MRPFEADEYVRGFDARIANRERKENPYRRPFFGAWDSYRQSAWDKGWVDAECGRAFHDPRKAVQR